MITMRTETKSVLDYLSHNNFLIPMYQRNYVWDEDECEKLFDDIYEFFENRQDDEPYFLGPVVIYEENNFYNIVDGQQRTTTLSILIRALYENSIHQKGIDKLIHDLAVCIWQIDPITGAINFEQMRLKSEVAMDSDSQSLKNLFREEVYISSKKLSCYERNFLYFRNRIDEFCRKKPYELFNFVRCLLDSCTLLPIKCNGFDNALRIFNTLNNRGTPLSTADIFKGLIFNHKKESERIQFAKEWKDLETAIENSDYLDKEDMSFLFLQYQHIIRAQHEEVDTVIPSVLEFYTKKDKLDSKKKNVNFAANADLLFQEESFEFIQKLGKFWCNPYDYLDAYEQKYFIILNLYQSKLWQMVLSTCFYQWEKGEKAIFTQVLPRLAAYNALALFHKKGGNSGIFWGFMKANVNIIKHNKNIFEKGLALPYLSMPSFDIFTENCKNFIPKQTRYILALYTLLYDSSQSLEWNKNAKNYSIKNAQIEHIFPKKWQDAYFTGFKKEEADEYLEQIGNKILLEKKENIQAANGYFKEKKAKYQNSHFSEARQLGKSYKENWTKEDIKQRTKQIYKKFEEFFDKMFKR